MCWEIDGGSLYLLPELEKITGNNLMEMCLWKSLKLQGMGKISLGEHLSHIKGFWVK